MGSGAYVRLHDQPASLPSIYIRAEGFATRHSLHGHAALFGVYGMLGIGLMPCSVCAVTGPRSCLERRLAAFCRSGR